MNEFLRPCMLWALGPGHLCVKSYTHQVPADIYHTRVQTAVLHNTTHCYIKLLVLHKLCKHFPTYLDFGSSDLDETLTECSWYENDED